MEKVNCNVQDCADGSKQLVFTIAGTQRVVGEIRFAGDMNYLLVISQMFSQYAGMQRGHLPSAIHKILNGKIPITL